jgi:hypothetical protein
MLQNPHVFATDPSEFSLEDQLPSFSTLQEPWLSRTVWLALFCLLGLGPAIAIRIAGSPAFLAAKPAPDHGKIEAALAPNESAKSDRLELPHARAETSMIAPAAEPMPAPTPPTSPETVKKTADRHWKNANARMIPAASPRPARSKESQPGAGEYRRSESAEGWHCRQDAVGSLMRSLDLSPRCQM